MWLLPVNSVLADQLWPLMKCTVASICSDPISVLMAVINWLYQESFRKAALRFEPTATRLNYRIRVSRFQLRIACQRNPAGSAADSIILGKFCSIKILQSVNQKSVQCAASLEDVRNWSNWRSGEAYETSDTLLHFVNAKKTSRARNMHRSFIRTSFAGEKERCAWCAIQVHMMKKNFPNQLKV